MNGETELTRLKLKQVLDVLRALMGNEHVYPGDMVYEVREREGEGWNGPSVTAWSKAVEDAEWHLKNAYPR